MRNCLQKMTALMLMMLIITASFVEIFAPVHIHNYGHVHLDEKSSHSEHFTNAHHLNSETHEHTLIDTYLFNDTYDKSLSTQIELIKALIALFIITSVVTIKLNPLKPNLTRLLPQKTTKGFRPPLRAPPLHV